MSDENGCDAVVVVIAIIVFSLPLTLLIPDFSVWNVVPKIRINRFHILSGELTWNQLNAVVLAILLVLFCLYLEMRKRKLDDLVEKVLTVNQATDVTMDVERERQAAAVKACVNLLDASTEHYEHLVLLSDDLRRKDRQKHNLFSIRQHPPTIDLSIADF